MEIVGNPDFCPSHPFPFAPHSSFSWLEVTPFTQKTIERPNQSLMMPKATEPVSKRLRSRNGLPAVSYALADIAAIKALNAALEDAEAPDPVRLSSQRNSVPTVVDASDDSVCASEDEEHSEPVSVSRPARQLGVRSNIPAFDDVSNDSEFEQADTASEEGDISAEESEATSEEEENEPKTAADSVPVSKRSMPKVTPSLTVGPEISASTTSSAEPVPTEHTKRIRVISLARKSGKHSGETNEYWTKMLGPQLKDIGSFWQHQVHEPTHETDACDCSIEHRQVVLSSISSNEDMSRHNNYQIREFRKLLHFEGHVVLCTLGHDGLTTNMPGYARLIGAAKKCSSGFSHFYYLARDDYHDFLGENLLKILAALRTGSQESIPAHLFEFFRAMARMGFHKELAANAQRANKQIAKGFRNAPDKTKAAPRLRIVTGTATVTAITKPRQFEKPCPMCGKPFLNNKLSRHVDFAHTMSYEILQYAASSDSEYAHTYLGGLLDFDS